MYYLARNEDETNINDYNPALLMAWRGNIDIQLCLGGFKFIINYITTYLKKDSSYSNSKASQAMKSEINLTDIQSIGIDLLKRRIVPATEMVDKLLQQRLYSFDADHIFVNTNAEENRKRTLLPYAVLRTLPLDAMAVAPNFADVVYPNRPACLVLCCYFNFVISFQRVIFLNFFFSSNSTLLL
jgi:hypothetical protein